MNDWVKIGAFDRLHQAELRKNALSQNNIDAVIVNEKDSAFLLGDIELWVDKGNAEKAQALLREFTGWYKVAYFPKLQALTVIVEILQRRGFEVLEVVETDPVFKYPVYEVYVPVAQAADVNELFDSPLSWRLLRSEQRLNQLVNFTHLLDAERMQYYVMQNRDENYMVQDWQLWVKFSDFDEANDTITRAHGWDLPQITVDAAKADYYVQQLELAGIPVICFDATDDLPFNLLVPSNFCVKAAEVIDACRQWSLVGTYHNLPEALMAKSRVTMENIPSVLITKKDSTFLIGDIELHVEAGFENQASELLLQLRANVERDDA